MTTKTPTPPIGKEIGKAEILESASSGLSTKRKPKGKSKPMLLVTISGLSVPRDHLNLS